MLNYLSSHLGRSSHALVKSRRSDLTIDRLEHRSMLSVAWDGGGDGVNWTDSLNWSSDLLPGPADDVVINAPDSSTLALTSGSQTIASLTLGRSLTVSGSASLLVTGAVNVNAGTLRFADGLSIADHTPRFQSLDVASGAYVDLTDNALVIDYPDFVSSLESLLNLTNSGYANGTWTGTGIGSSTAAVTPGTGVGVIESSRWWGSTFVGQPIDDSSVLLRYTFNGDANLDRTVEFIDLLILAKTYGEPWTIDWVDSDFSGTVDFPDLLSVAQHFGQTLQSGATETSSSPIKTPLSSRKPSRLAGDVLV